jgi:hypothetical protein
MKMTDPYIYCKECGGMMSYIENSRYNEFYSIKIDTWRCQRCNRVVEEKRLDKDKTWK